MQEHSLYCYLQRQPAELLETILYGYLKSAQKPESEKIMRMVLEICQNKGYFDSFTVRDWEARIEEVKAEAQPFPPMHFWK